MAFLIKECRSVSATDGRDKVYTALCMMRKARPHPSDMIRPSYEATVQEVYITTTRELLQHLPFLAVLSSVEDKSCRKLSGLPSWVLALIGTWVPTSFVWSGKLEPNPREYVSEYVIGESWPLMLGKLYDASLCREIPHPRLDIQTTTLTLYGACHDTVAALSTGIINLLSLSPISSGFSICVFIWTRNIHQPDRTEWRSSGER